MNSSNTRSPPSSSPPRYFEGPIRTNLSTRSYRACIWCRSHKRKCDGMEPCSTCLHSHDGRVCAYATPKKRGRKVKRHSLYDEKVGMEQVQGRQCLPEEDSMNMNMMNESSPLRTIDQVSMDAISLSNIPNSPLSPRQDFPVPLPDPPTSKSFPSTPITIPGSPRPYSVPFTSNSPNSIPFLPSVTVTDATGSSTSPQYARPKPGPFVDGYTSPGLYSYSSKYMYKSPPETVSGLSQLLRANSLEDHPVPPISMMTYRDPQRPPSSYSKEPTNSDFPLRSWSTGDYPPISSTQNKNALNARPDFPIKSFSVPMGIGRDFEGNTEEVGAPGGSSPAHSELRPPIYSSQNSTNSHSRLESSTITSSTTSTNSTSSTLSPRGSPAALRGGLSAPFLDRNRKRNLSDMTDMPVRSTSDHSYLSNPTDNDSRPQNQKRWFGDILN